MCADRNAPFDRLLGTSLVLYPDGSAERQTVRPEGWTDIIEVMPHR